MASANNGDLVFKRGKNSEDHEDIWDDSVLIEAYERAASLAYDTVRANMQSNGEFSAEDLMKHGSRGSVALDRNDSVAGNSSVSGNQSGANKKTKNKKRRSQRKKWKVGDRCLSKYSEDDAWYEATVVAIDRTHNRCTVRYTGYENEEDVNLGMLKKCPDASLDEDASSQSDLEGNGEIEDESEAAAVLEQNKFFNTVSTLPPPIPPHLLKQNSLPQEDEAVSAMLMSWYTSGYHTGYYQAMRDMKTANAEK